MTRPLFLIAMFLLAETMSLVAGRTGDEIHFKSGTITPEQNSETWIARFSPESGQIYRSRFYTIIQFSAIPSEQQREELRASGVQLLDYLPEMAYFASIRMDFNREVLQTMPVRSILGIHPQYKLDRLLYEQNYPPYALLNNGRIRLVVSYFPDLEPDAVVASFLEKNVMITGRDDFGKVLYAEAALSEIEAIAGFPWVMFVEPGAAEPQPENYTGRTLHHTNAIATDFPGGRQYDGTGVNAVIQDDGIIGPHIDYQGRIGAQYLTNNGGDHGDHCSGILMGGGNRDPRAKGNGFGATLWVYSVSPGYPGFTAIPTTYTSLGIRVTSASYGDGCNVGYTTLTRTLDQQVRTYPSLMHVFSAGNSGTDNCGYGAGAGWGNITGGHKQGKNVLAIANLDAQDEVASSSSRGPAHDGRIKPDVGAKGTNVYSTINPNSYGSKTGTSMACPAVAGTLTQLIHAYRELNNGQDPMAGLLKATLLNTAEDLGNPGPDFKYGWGRINALRAVQLFEQLRYDSGVVSQGMAGSHTVVVPPNTAQVRIMVYWTDYEASVNTTWALVNNLEMTVTDPSSNTWLPWVLSHYPHADSLNKTAVRGTDNRNNMEQVTLTNPAPGSYVVDVQGLLVPQGPQTYYVVWEFIPEEVVLTYPVGGESLAPGEQELVRWDAFGSTDPFTIEFSANDGQDWDTVVDNFPANARFYAWTVPSILTGKALLRVSRNGSVSQNEEPFSIMGVPCNLHVDRACDTALHFTWSEVGGATAYRVYRLGEKYMEAIGTTTINSFIVPDPGTTESTWLSVAALGPDSATGRRAVAIEKTPGTLNCYPVDAMLAASPVAQWGVFHTCTDPDAVTVSVDVRNTGFTPLVNPLVSYRLNNGTTVSAPTGCTILPDSTCRFTFPETIDLSTTGSYELKTWVTYPQDQFPDNDSLIMPLEVTDGIVFPTDGTEDFDSWTKCLSSPICELYTCEPEDGWLNLTNGIYDAHDWRTFSGGTPTAGTGPDNDHTLGTSSGQYLYLEPTMYCTLKPSILATPCIDLTGSAGATASLWYHAYGSDIGSFHVDVFDGSTVTEDAVPAVSGTRGNAWQKLEINLTPWAGKMITLHFRGMTGCADRGDFAIDDFGVEQVMVSMEEPEGTNDNRMKLIPNPASGEVIISLKEAGSEPYMMRITDLYGRVKRSMEVGPKGNRIYELLDIHDLAAGIYLVDLTGGHTVYHAKLIVRQ